MDLRPTGNIALLRLTATANTRPKGSWFHDGDNGILLDDRGRIAMWLTDNYDM